MSDIGTPHAGGAVDEALTVAVGDVNAFTFSDQRSRLCADGAGDGPRLYKMTLGQRNCISVVYLSYGGHWPLSDHSQVRILQAFLTVILNKRSINIAEVDFNFNL